MELCVFQSQGRRESVFPRRFVSAKELIIPVVAMTPLVPAKSAPLTSSIEWTLTPGTPKLTTRFFSVQMAGVSSGLFELEPPKVRLEIRARGKCVSQSVSASYGFEDATGEIKLKVMPTDTKSIESNTVAMMVIEEIAQKTVSVHLLDATSGAELARLDKIEVAISL
jgi:hypothetical protein